MGHYLLALIFMFALSSSQGINLLEDCSTDTTGCPAFAQCQLFGCRNKVCICDAGFINNDDGTTCFRLIDLDNSCADPNTTCRWGSCIDGVCTCASGQMETTEKRCKRAPFADITVALLNEDCDEANSVFCLDGLTQECAAGKCSCKTDFKPTTDDLKAAMPEAGECVRSSLEVGSAITTDCAPILQDVPIGEECTIDAQCPVGVTCQSVGCTQQCACGTGTAPSADKLRCLEIKNLGDTCDISSICGTLHSLCFGGSCICDGTTEPTAAGLCRRKSPAPGVFQYATVEETCDGSSKLCEDGLQCDGSTVCDCSANFRRFDDVEERLKFGYPGYCIHNSVTAVLSPQEIQDLCGPQPPAASSDAASSSTSLSVAASSSVAESSSVAASSSVAESSSVAASSSVAESSSVAASSSVAESSSVAASSSVAESPSVAASSSVAESSSVAASSSVAESPSVTPSSSVAAAVSSSAVASSSVAESSSAAAASSATASVAASATSSSAFPSAASLAASQSQIASSSSVVQTEPLPSATSSSQPATSAAVSSMSSSIAPTSASQQPASSSVIPSGPTPMVGDNCTDSAECPPGAQCLLVNCARRQCVCAGGTKANSQQTACLATAQLTEACNDSVTCWAAGSDCNLGICSCGSPYIEVKDNKFCVRENQKLLGESCTGDGDCLGVLSACSSSSVCECSAGNRPAVQIETDNQQDLWHGLGQCRTDATPIPEPGQDVTTSTAECTLLAVGATCQDDALCPLNSKCVAAVGVCNKRCWCNKGFAPDQPSPTKCVPVVSLGNPCVNGQQKCRGLGTYCYQGRCSCIRPSLPTANGFCRPYYPGINMALLGETCGGTTFCFNKQEQECTDGVCVCRVGRRNASELDLNVQYANSYQCRQSTDIDGYRPPLTCDEAPIALVQDPPDFSEEIAATANAGHAGIIAYIMVPAGLIVLTTLVAFAVIRYRRRKRLQEAEDMMSSTSESQSEQQDWSLPRPTITPFRGDRNWSEVQSEYNNPTFMQSMS